MSIFKQTLAQEIQDQLTARTKVVQGSGSLESFSPGRSQLLPWYLSKNSWVRMTSMVNFTSGKATPVSGSIEVKGDGIWTGDQLSRRYVLEGGMLYAKENGGVELEAALRENIGTAGGSYGGNFDLNGNGQSDEYSRQFGIRPMPGIESVNLRTVGAYGSIFSTTVKFYAWDTKQLNDLEILFMRPGYSVLLEWGWSQYINNKNIPTVFNGKTINAFVPLTQQKIYDKLQTLRKEYDHNYDGMLGYVKNFSWKMMRNGGYECTTELISMGEVINSLKISTNNLRLNSNDKPDFDFSKKSNYVYDDYENLLISLKASGEGVKYKPNDPEKKLFIDEDEYKGNWNYDKNYISRGKVIEKLKQNGHAIIAENLNKLPINKKISTGEENNPQGQYYEYLPLDVVMAIMDSYFNIVVTSKKGENINNNPQKSVRIIPPGKDDYCLAGKDSISVDPNVCLVGSTLAFQEEFTYGFNPVITKPGEKLGVVIPVRQTVLNGKQLVRSSEISTLNRFYEEEINSARIANIFVNINLLLNEYKNLKNSANDDGVNFMTYMKNVLSRISNALGGLNNFILSTAGRDQNTLRIVDTYYLEQKSDKYEFDLIGLGSICREVDIESQIFPEQSTIVAVAAQSRANLGDIYNSTQVYLNAGIEDRIAIEKQQQEEKDTLVNKGNPYNAFYQKLFEFLLYVRDNIVGTKIETTSQGVTVTDFSISTDNSGTVPSTFLKQFMLKYNGELNFKALIPFKLTIKLDGIGGIIVGEIFKVKQNVLPRNYYDKNLGFIITEIQHNLVKNDWETTLTTQICLLDAIKLGKDFITDTRQGFKDFIALGIKDSLIFPALVNYMEYLALQAYIVTVINLNSPRQAAEVISDNKSPVLDINVIKTRIKEALTNQSTSPKNFQEFFKKWVFELENTNVILDTPITNTETYAQALDSLVNSQLVQETSVKIQNNLDLFSSFDNNGIWTNVFNSDFTKDGGYKTLQDNIESKLKEKDIVSSSIINVYKTLSIENGSSISIFTPINNDTSRKIFEPFVIKRKADNTYKFISEADYNNSTNKLNPIATDNTKILLAKWFKILNISSDADELAKKLIFREN